MLNENHSNEKDVILLVDDESSFRHLVSDVLLESGYSILEASNVAGALETLRSHQINLVISDVVMDDGDGFQLLAKIKDQYPLIKVLLVSGYSEFIGKPENVELLKKPFKTNDLLLKVENLLAESRQI